MNSERYPSGVDDNERQLSNAERNLWNIDRIRDIQSTRIKLDKYFADEPDPDNLPAEITELQDSIRLRTAELIEGNLELIYHTANQFTRHLPHHNREDARNELESELTILMIESAYGYDLDDGRAKFSTYFKSRAIKAVNSVNVQNCFKIFFNDRSAVNETDKLQKLVEFYNDFNGYVGQNDENGLPTFVSLDDWMEQNKTRSHRRVRPGRTHAAFRLQMNQRLLDLDYIYERASIDEESSYEVQAPSRHPSMLWDADPNNNPEIVAMRGIARHLVQDAVSQLKERHQLVLKQRFGLDGGAPKTLEEVGQTIGVTRERVRQIEATALSHLRLKFRDAILGDASELMETGTLRDEDAGLQPIALKQFYNPHGPESKTVIHRDHGVIFVRNPKFHRLSGDRLKDIPPETDDEYHSRAGSYLAGLLRAVDMEKTQRVVFDTCQDGRLIFRAVKNTDGQTYFAIQLKNSISATHSDNF